MTTQQLLQHSFFDGVFARLRRASLRCHAAGIPQGTRTGGASGYQKKKTVRRRNGTSCVAHAARSHHSPGTHCDGHALSRRAMLVDVLMVVAWGAAIPALMWLGAAGGF